MKTDTIAAIASAMTPSGIGIIRISGEEAFSVIDRIYISSSGKKRLSECDSHTIHYGYIKDGETVIDEVMVLLMRAPHSYTREDSVEIDCHGGVYVMRKLLDTVIRHGARLAEPGEFTKRAFLNGRIDLTQAESVIELINSKNEFALQSSVQQLRGTLRDDVRRLRRMILHEIAYIESALDDPEHISLEGYPQRLGEIVAEVKGEIEKLLAHSEDGKLRKEGIRTVIVGKPNAGKSSILNILVGEERAIVTEIAGTTRDIIEEQVNLGGITLNIVDTAGIRETSDVVERIGVGRAEERMEQADLILYIIDSSIPLDENDRRIMQKVRGKKGIALLNKSDLASVVEEEDIRELWEQRVIVFSAKEELGLEELESAIREMFFRGEVNLNDEVCITNLRQKSAFRNTLDALSLVERSIEYEMPEDFYSIDLMSAYEALGAVIGEAVEDDLVEEIFSKFCMGK